jgi:hypothetical protein
MRIRLVKLEQLSGEQASIYSVMHEEDQITLFDKFINENKNSFKSELTDIVLRLKIIGNKTGAREHFFKQHEGKPGDGVCALYDEPRSNLRLYCIRYGTTLIVIGSGGHKPKTIKSLQDDPKLKKENLILREISKLISEKISQGTISYTDDYFDFEGNLDLNTIDYE